MSVNQSGGYGLLVADLDLLVARMRPYATSIFGAMSARAAETGAVNLGQGFPDVDGPDELKRIAMAAIADGSGNQYPPAHGMPVLRKAIATHQGIHYGLNIDPHRGVVVTTGASEALAAAMLALVSSGDEVIVFEPYFDLYAAIIALAGATRVCVPLTVPRASGASFRLDSDQLRTAITPRTKAIIVNSPHNPTGMVLTAYELRQIADVALEFDLIVISDEAYEHLVYPAAVHTPIAALAGMFDRTITVGSGGKSFSFTGWKVGWASGPPRLIEPTRVVRQHLSYVSGGPFQAAIAAGLEFPADYFTQFAATLQRRRDLLSRGLSELGFSTFQTDGTYFVTSDLGPIANGDGRAACNELIEHAGVAAIPLQALCDDEQTYGGFIRWTFCKQDAVLAEGLDRLSRFVANRQGTTRASQ